MGGADAPGNLRRDKTIICPRTADGGPPTKALLMRLDSYLSDTRLIKRRTQAKKACENKIVLVDGTVAKPGKEVRVGQKITVNFTNRTVEVEVLEVPSKSVKKEDAKNFYRTIREEVKKTWWLSEEP
jgi:ribosomal 50S subunit-recycling heat shock protein